MAPEVGIQRQHRAPAVEPGRDEDGRHGRPVVVRAAEVAVGPERRGVPRGARGRRRRRRWTSRRSARTARGVAVEVSAARDPSRAAAGAARARRRAPRGCLGPAGAASRVGPRLVGVGRARGRVVVALARAEVGRPHSAPGPPPPETQQASVPASGPHQPVIPSSFLMLLLLLLFIIGRT